MTTATHTKPYKENGIWNYTELPEGFHVATPADFDILSEEIVFGITVMFKPSHLNYQVHNITYKNIDNWKSDIKSSKVFINKLPTKIYGLWQYPSLPLGCRKALNSDFLTDDLKLITGIDFLALGMYKIYEAHRTGTIEKFIPWLDWITAGRIFIKA